MSEDTSGLRPGTMRWWAVVIVLVGLVFSVFSYARFHGHFAMKERQRQMRERVKERMQQKNVRPSPIAAPKALTANSKG